MFTFESEGTHHRGGEHRGVEESEVCVAVEDHIHPPSLRAVCGVDGGEDGGVEEDSDIRVVLLERERHVKHDRSIFEVCADDER